MAIDIWRIRLSVSRNQTIAVKQSNKIMAWKYGCTNPRTQL